ncbi:hypothetical protein SLEP1_g17821 [Rubroshorea leprosula]|uniref:Uncharacterized protein n=1 Tax=Rubroshorea leprosula TaxID=152421 RepID=A0AAV5J4K9_9ROSI|nr:hypothetical protein SLEP1_g17821 [Rubroshorea leprosula]
MTSLWAMRYALQIMVSIFQLELLSYRIGDCRVV